MTVKIPGLTILVVHNIPDANAAAVSVGGGWSLSLMVVEFLRTTPAQLVIGLTTLLILSIVGVYVVLRFRDSTEGDETTSDLLTKFREMHHQGYLDESEYRTIRTDLNEKLSEELEAKKREV